VDQMLLLAFCNPDSPRAQQQTFSNPGGQQHRACSGRDREQTRPRWRAQLALGWSVAPEGLGPLPPLRLPIRVETMAWTLQRTLRSKRRTWTWFQPSLDGSGVKRHGLLTHLAWAGVELADTCAQGFTPIRCARTPHVAGSSRQGVEILAARGQSGEPDCFYDPAMRARGGEPETHRSPFALENRAS